MKRKLAVLPCHREVQGKQRSQTPMKPRGNRDWVDPRPVARPQGNQTSTGREVELVDYRPKGGRMLLRMHSGREPPEDFVVDCEHEVVESEASGGQQRSVKWRVMLA